MHTHRSSLLVSSHHPAFLSQFAGERKKERRESMERRKEEGDREGKEGGGKTRIGINLIFNKNHKNVIGGDSGSCSGRGRRSRCGRSGLATRLCSFIHVCSMCVVVEEGRGGPSSLFLF